MNTANELGLKAMQYLDSKGVQHGYYSVVGDGCISLPVGKNGRLHIASIPEELRGKYLPFPTELAVYISDNFLKSAIDFESNPMAIPDWAAYVALYQLFEPQ